MGLGIATPRLPTHLHLVVAVSVPAAAAAAAAAEAATNVVVVVAALPCLAPRRSRARHLDPLLLLDLLRRVTVRVRVRVGVTARVRALDLLALERLLHRIEQACFELGLGSGLGMGLG